MVGVLLVVLAVGWLAYQPSLNPLDNFPGSTPSKQGYDLLAKHFPAGALAPTTVLIQYPKAAPAGQAQAITETLKKNPLVLDASPTGTGEAGSVLRYQVELRGDPYATEAVNGIATLRADLTKTVGTAGGVVLGGQTVKTADLQDLSTRDLFVVGLIALITIGVLLGFLLRSLVAPLVLVGTTLLLFVAALGVTILVSRYLFGYHGVSLSTPIIALVFLVALGSDYNIFIATRLRAEAMTHGLQDGTARAVAATGVVLMSAGLVLAGTFAVLTTQPSASYVQLGVAVALGVLIATFLIGTGFVPGLIRAIGPGVGWPFRRWGPPEAESGATEPATESNA
jgi:uncharacterized membrane protein YdfJ with MMPL/SSD domain